MDQATQSRQSHEIATNRLARQYPEIGEAINCVKQLCDTAGVNVSAVVDSGKSVVFRVEHAPDGKTFEPAVLPVPNTAKRARDLQSAAIAFAKQHPGRKVRVKSPEKARAVLCFRANETGEVSSY